MAEILNIKNPDGSYTATTAKNLPNIPSTLTAANLQPSPTSNFQLPAPTFAPVVPEVPKLELTAPETTAEGYSTTLQALNRSLIGESAYRIQQEQTQDISGKQQTLNDLTGRLTNLKATYDSIPLQTQQMAEGKGITAGGLAPITASEQRKVAIESLGVSALHQAAQGNLTTALDLVDRAVKAKYDPVREEINASMNNLQLILNSPSYTIAQKNRAQAQLAVQDERQKALGIQEQNDKDKHKIAIDAASLGADAVTLQKIQNAPDAITAQQLATQAGFVPQEKLDTSIIDANGRKYLINNQTGETIKDLGVSKTGGGSGGSFTTTQTNVGAANAGLAPDEFSNLPIEVKNTFINDKNTAQLLVETVSDATSGLLTRAEAVTDIEKENVPQEVKDYFISLLPAQDATQEEGGLWSWINNLFSKPINPKLPTGV